MLRAMLLEVAENGALSLPDLGALARDARQIGSNARVHYATADERQRNNIPSAPGARLTPPAATATPRHPEPQFRHSLRGLRRSTDGTH